MVPPHGPTRGPRPITVLIPPLRHGPMHDPGPIAQSWSPMHRPCPIMVLLAAPAPPGNPGPIVPAWSHLLRTKACRRRLLDAGMGMRDSSRRTFLPPFSLRQGQSCCFPPRGLAAGHSPGPAPWSGVAVWSQPGQGPGEAHVSVAPTCLRWPQNPITAPSAWVDLVVWAQRDTKHVPTGMSAQVGCAAIILPWKGFLHPPIRRGNWWPRWDLAPAPSRKPQHVMGDTCGPQGGVPSAVSPAPSLVSLVGSITCSWWPQQWLQTGHEGVRPPWYRWCRCFGWRSPGAKSQGHP